MPIRLASQECGGDRVHQQVDSDAATVCKNRDGDFAVTLDGEDAARARKVSLMPDHHQTVLGQPR
jgi:hypothetical protein